MTLEELETLIEEVENWHKVRGGLNKKPRKKPLVMDTLPWVLVALNNYRDLLLAGAPEEIKPQVKVSIGDREWTLDEILGAKG